MIDQESEYDFDDFESYKYADKVLSEKTNSAVLEFVKRIITGIKKTDSDIVVSLRREMMVNTSNESYASSIAIVTKFGIVLVLPDFANNFTYAYIMNRGIMNAMTLEGYTQEYILTAGKIYSSKFIFNAESVKSLIHYLTRFLNK